MFFKRAKHPKSSAELADEAEIEKLSKEATFGELDNEERVIRRARSRSGLGWGRRNGPVGFFNSPGVTLKDDEQYSEEPSNSDQTGPPGE